MMHQFNCVHVYEDQETECWSASWEIMAEGLSGVELLISGRSTVYKVIVGKCESGNFFCIPAIDVGCGLADLTDVFWNQEKLTRVIGGETDAVTISLALCDYEKTRREVNNYYASGVLRFYGEKDEYE